MAHKSPILKNLVHNKSMRKLKSLILFFCVIIAMDSTACCFSRSAIFLATAKTYKSCESLENERVYVVKIDGRVFEFSSENFKIKKEQKENLLKPIKSTKTAIKKLESMGFSQAEIVQYLCPETKQIKEFLECRFCKKEGEDKLETIKNTCKIQIKKGECGLHFEPSKFYSQILKGLEAGDKEIQISLELKTFKKEAIKETEFVQKGCFSTSFSTSTEERKNNIKIALAVFDGLVLEPGEILSFNSQTGVRDAQNGYLPAKIISGGTFVSGYGGGVCQVSTTLYNACLLSGLEIVEVHSHSLPVGYVEPGFDAMVNSGSSDLVVRNNTSGKIVITTSCDEGKCKVKIFGQKNEYKITRVSEKKGIIPAGKDRVETDAERFGILDFGESEEIRLSYPKDGFYASGYLNYYKNGCLVKTEKIRDSKYLPTEGIVLRKE